MTASVAMCTYNGALYIEEQLRSILAQTVPVNEIVICDDGSTDATISVIEKVREDIERLGMHLLLKENRTPLGVNANFEKAMGLCSGDIIFLSDQDDVWETNKVETIARYFEEHPKKQVVFGNAWLIDDNGNKLTERTLLDVAGFSIENQWYFDHGYAWELWCQENRATGATMAVRRPFIKGMSMTMGNIQYHDAVLAIEALKENALGYIMEPLIRYRRHRGQESGDFDYTKTYNANILTPALPHFDFAARMVCTEVLRRLNFMGQRCSFLYGWFGIRSIVHLRKYRKHYGKLWWRFMGFDICNSIIHSINRIRRKVSVIIK